MVAALLAGAGAEAAAALVRVNLAELPDDDRRARARSLLEEAGTGIDRARDRFPTDPAVPPARVTRDPSPLTRTRRTPRR